MSQEGYKPWITLLEGLHSVRYGSYIEPLFDKEVCKVDREAWKTSLDFVANQSTALKFVKQIDHEKEADNRVKNVPQPKGVDPAELAAWRTALKEADAYSGMPSLTIYLTTIPMNGVCVGEVRAELGALLEPSKMKFNGREVHYPNHIVWQKSIWVRAPINDFSNSMIRTGEEVMKKLVNDWTDSQK